VRHRLLGFGIPQIAAHLTTRYGLESHRRHELSRARREHYLDLGALLPQSAHEIGTLVSGDAARDAE
jgi:hypothetical protein